MVLKPTLLLAQVMHKRLQPKVNHFTYGVYYVVCPLSQIHTLNDKWRFGVNRRGLLSLLEKDHGARDGSRLENWIRRILNDSGIKEANGEVVLVTMPRVLGYVFNPVSFFLCLDNQGHLRAVLAEVNNTFKEHHNYLCAHGDHHPIHHEDWIIAKKIFHVSPFLERQGEYRFRFKYTPNSLGIRIDYFNEHSEMLLITSLNGALIAWSRKMVWKAFWQYPWLTFKVILKIHWQAAKLLSKGIRFISKSKQHTKRLTGSLEIDK